MNSKSLKTIRGAKRLLSSALIVAGLGFATSAVSYPVTEIGPNQVWNLLSQIQSKMENLTQETRWLQTLQQYASMLTTLNSRLNSFNLAQGQPLTEIPEDKFVAETCGAGGAVGLLRDGLSSLSMNKDGDYRAQQKQICVRIQMLKNRRYNETVRFTAQYVPQVQASVGRISEFFNTNRTLGDRDGAQFELTKTTSELGSAAQDWKNRMEMYDQSIRSLEDSQRTLAQMALKGNNGALGTIVQTATLKGALEL